MTFELALLIDESTLNEMMPYIVVIVLTCLFVLGVSAAQAWYLYQSWIKRKELNHIFPFWNNTRKPFIWWLCWSVVDGLFAIIIVLIIAISQPKLMIGVVGAFLGIFLYNILLRIVRAIMQHIIIKNHKNSNDHDSVETGEPPDCLQKRSYDETEMSTSTFQVEQQQSEELKLKAKCRVYKWVFTLFFLSGNFALLVDMAGMAFYICVGILANGLAVATFVLLSIFPRTYYVFDQEKVSIRSQRGKEKRCIFWKDVDLFVYMGVKLFSIEAVMQFRIDGDAGEQQKKSSAAFLISLEEYHQVIAFCKLKERFNIKFY